MREELKLIQQKLKITTVYVTHDQEEALSLSDKIAVINDGSLLQYGTPRELYFKPQDNFTADFVGRANFVSLENETYIIRPEWFELNKTEKPGVVEGKVVSASFLGDRTRFVIAASKIEGSACSVSITADLPTLETNFLEKDGGIVPDFNTYDDVSVQELAKKSILPSGILETETLAVILEKQGKLAQALAVYEKLMVNNPEKSSTFAVRIASLKARMNEDK